MKYYIIAGEPSGDLHGSNLMKAILKKDPQASFKFWGGDLMQAVYPGLVTHYKKMAFMGFIEVVKNLKTISSYFKLAKSDIKEFNPNVVIFIDYPGFNLRMARWCKVNGYKVSYYISPQIWAWHSSRLKDIKKYVDKMLVVLPFEKQYYADHGVEVDFVGHPLLDAIQSFKALPIDIEKNQKPIIALLPGSRKQEIEKILPHMLSVMEDFGDYQFVIGGLRNHDGLYQHILGGMDVPIVWDKTYDLLASSELALVSSGTATLEAALFNVPQVVCYFGNKVSFLIARRLVNLKYISLVNLIMDKEVVEELIQYNLNKKSLTQALADIAGPKKQAILKDYQELKSKLGISGASSNAAQIITDFAKEDSNI